MFSFVFSSERIFSLHRERFASGFAHYSIGEAVANHPAGDLEGEAGRVHFQTPENY